MKFSGEQLLGWFRYTFRFVFADGVVVVYLLRKFIVAIGIVVAYDTRGVVHP